MDLYCRHFVMEVTQKRTKCLTRNNTNNNTTT